MIHYHGTPITPDRAAAEILKGRHGLVSFAHPEQIALVAEICQSFVLDSGAFSLWKTGKQLDIDAYYTFIDDWRSHPGFDWALIPDVIDGTELANDSMLDTWDLGPVFGVPVWHLHESFERLIRLGDRFGRVALGSSGQFAKIGTPEWWQRVTETMDLICPGGRPLFHLHGLRMLDPKVFSMLPFSSADSTNIARNIGTDQKWTRGHYLPPTKAARGIVMATRIENQQSASEWKGRYKTCKDDSQ